MRFEVAITRPSFSDTSSYTSSTPLVGSRRRSSAIRSGTTTPMTTASSSPSTSSRFTRSSLRRESESLSVTPNKSEYFSDKDIKKKRVPVSVKGKGKGKGTESVNGKRKFKQEDNDDFELEAKQEDEEELELKLKEEEEDEFVPSESEEDFINEDEDDEDEKDEEDSSSDFEPIMKKIKIAEKRNPRTSRPPSSKRKSQKPSKASIKIKDEESNSLIKLDDGDENDEDLKINDLTPRPTARRDRTYKKLPWHEKVRVQLIEQHKEVAQIWDEFQQGVIKVPQRAEAPLNLKCKLLVFQQESLYWMKNQESSPYRGGILADEMGMGKTIQMISLILCDEAIYPEKEGPLQTLVITPTVAIMQWRNEIEKFASHLKVCVWHGASRSKYELEDYDIILTSYSILESVYRKQMYGFQRKKQIVKENSILHQIKWHRVILDEAHNIKERVCKTAKAAFALDADYRWCLSGTPLQNRVGELYSLIRFLGVPHMSKYYCKKCPCSSLEWSFSDNRTCDICNHTPMSHVSLWNNEILKPIQKYGAGETCEHDDGRRAFRNLKILLDRMMLRRTKIERANDLGLPPRTIRVRSDFFSEEELELYSSLYQDVKRNFNSYIDEDSVLNNYANIFTLITRMRQMACHPDLVLKSKTSKIANISEEINTCRICLDEAEDAIAAQCRHLFCRTCVSEYVETAITDEPECPVCHKRLTIDLSAEAIEITDTKHQGMLARIDPTKWRTSTKIEALVEELGKLKTDSHSHKSLVFSQFTSFLDLIARRLQLAGYKVARLQGSMSPEARDRTIKYFMNNNDVTVFLLSLKAGGVALNLTEASRVFIMDPWWNPAAELQAMDRIHRLGQHRPIIVTRLIIEDSIESKIVQLQRKKESMVGAALGDDDQALGRLTPQDLQFLFTM